MRASTTTAGGDLETESALPMESKLKDTPTGSVGGKLGDEVGANPATEKEIWYKNPDTGSFFMERRAPFFYFNFLLYAGAMATFGYMAYTITTDYQNQQVGPPTSTILNPDLNLEFPGIILCNLDPDVMIEPLYVGYDNGTADAPYDILDQAKRIDCPQYDLSQCIIIDGKFPAFESSEGPSGVKQCSRRNTMTIIASVNSEAYSNTSLFVGAYAFLFEGGQGAAVSNAFCNAENTKCRSLENATDTCDEDSSKLSLDDFIVSSNVGSYVYLNKRLIQESVSCNQYVQSWNPNVQTMAINPRAFENIFEANYTESGRDAVSITLEFSDSKVTEISYNPTSTSAMFGSLAGWFGVLTDGWGLVTVGFHIERLVLYFGDIIFGTGLVA